MLQPTDTCLKQGESTEKEKVPTKDPDQRQSVGHFLRLLFALLEENGIGYCVLHSWETLPDKLVADLDLAVHPRDRWKLGSVFQSLLGEGYQPAQCCHHVGGYAFDFAWPEAHRMRYARVDIAFEIRQASLLLMPGEAMVLGRRQETGFWRADPEVEFAYLLIKKTLKEFLPDRQVERLKALVREIGSPAATKIAGTLFGEQWRERVVAACMGETLGDLLADLKKRLWVTRLLKDPLSPLRFLLGEVPRLISRAVKPEGILLAILGPDGVGKSTLVGRISESLVPAVFRKSRILHWRPMVLAPRNRAPVTNPHAQPARGSLKSILVLLVIFLDYWVAYLVIIRPTLVRSGLVIFDRCYHDLLIDPLRYRYGGPIWLARFLGRFIPVLDLLFLVLDADEEVIFSRRREVAPDELGRQRQGYRQFSAGAKRAILINADRGIEHTFEEATRFIVEFLAHRSQHRHAHWFAPVC